MNQHQIVITIFVLSVYFIHLTTAVRFVPKWKKQACEVPANQNDQSHYTCDDNGEVKCLPGQSGDSLFFFSLCTFQFERIFIGWQGDLCNVPMCRKGCDPMQGYCKRPGECRCNLGFYGEKCDRCIPLPGCQHGYCNVSFECVCHKGWDGLFCTDRKLNNVNMHSWIAPNYLPFRLAICREDCHPTRGYCEGPSECRCRWVLWNFVNETD